MTTGVSSSQEDERCPLCPESGPPTKPLTEDDDPSQPPAELVWIACSRCETWYHSPCILMAGAEGNNTAWVETVPEAVRGEVYKQEEKEFFDWTVWIDKWFCRSCLDKANDPANPTPLHRPLTATTKPNFPPRTRPKKAAAKKMTPKRSISTSSRASPSPSQVDKKQKVEHESEQAETLKGVSNGVLNGIGHGEEGAGKEKDAEGADGAGAATRPKRQAAMKRPDYHAMHHQIATPTSKWLDLIADPGRYNCVILDADYPTIRGEVLSRAWLEKRQSSSAGPSYQGPSSPDSTTTLGPTSFYGPSRTPIIIRPEDGGFESLGGKIPGAGFTVDDVARLVGPDRIVDVIDVSTQQSSSWPLSQWADYVAKSQSATKPNSSSDSPHLNKVYNIISLEISDTELAKKVKAPRLVSEIDWVDNFWPFGPTGKAEAEAVEVKPAAGAADAGTGTGEQGKSKGKGRTSSWPKVQLYCLMGMKGSWTDWHIDFAASSVYYTIHSGSKVFYFIRPTEQNLKAYAEWSGSYEMQQNTWLGDMCDEVRRVVLRAGDTMIIPAGYIHSVYTPMNSIVFGGNFIHSYDIETQLRLRQIEIDTKVPQRFRFPYFDKLCWYVADRYCADLRLFRAYRPRATHSLPSALPHPRILNQLTHLVTFLRSQVKILEDDTEEDKKRNLIHGRIPSDVVKDASGAIRELEWRLKRELGEAEDQEVQKPLSIVPQLNGSQSHKSSTNGHGPKDSVNGVEFIIPPRSRTKAFYPEPWQVDEIDTKHVQVPSTLNEDGSETAPGGMADRTTTVQRRSRWRTLEGQKIHEEQEMTLVETRTFWP